MPDMPETALVLGGAACLHADMEAALALFTPDVLVATNHAGRDHNGPVDHWATLHPELMPRWAAERAAAGRPPAGSLWTANHKQVPKGLSFRIAKSVGGSSGLFAVVVALELGCRRVVLAGVPLDRNEAHYDDARHWQEAHKYRPAWNNFRATMAGRVRSMSGWTRTLLGVPTAEWIAGC